MYTSLLSLYPPYGAQASGSSARTLLHAFLITFFPLHLLVPLCTKSAEVKEEAEASKRTWTCACGPILFSAGTITFASFSFFSFSLLLLLLLAWGFVWSSLSCSSSWWLFLLWAFGNSIIGCSTVRVAGRAGMSGSREVPWADKWSRAQWAGVLWKAATHHALRAINCP